MRRRMVAMLMFGVIALANAGCAVVEIPVRAAEKGGEALVDGANWGGNEIQYVTGLKPRPQQATLAAPVRAYSPDEIFSSQLRVEDPELLERIAFLMNDRVDPKEWPAWRLRVAAMQMANSDSDDLVTQDELSGFYRKTIQGWGKAEADRLLADLEQTAPNGTPSSPVKAGPRQKTGWK